jgi:hypothetical protein
MNSKLVYWAITVALVAMVLAIYTPSLDFQFILDDHHFVNDPRCSLRDISGNILFNYVWAQV